MTPEIVVSFVTQIPLVAAFIVSVSANRIEGVKGGRRRDDLSFHYLAFHPPRLALGRGEIRIRAGCVVCTRQAQAGL